MRDAVIDRELEHLRVDHDQPALLRREPVEQRQDHGVDGDRLARAGGAGHQQVRHAGQIRDHRLAADGLAEAKRQLVLGGLEVLGGKKLTQVNGLALLVRQLDADGVAAWDDRHAGRDRAHGAGDVVRQRDHARGFDAGRGLELVERHHRTGMDMDHLALDAEVADRLLDAPAVSSRISSVSSGPSRSGGSARNSI